MGKKFRFESVFKIPSHATPDEMKFKNGEKMKHPAGYSAPMKRLTCFDIFGHARKYSWRISDLNMAKMSETRKGK